MGHQLVSITPAGKPTFRVPFNPTNYSLSKANQIAEAAVPGLNAPILQYVHGNTRTLDMELFFDTYEKGTTVTSPTIGVDSEQSTAVSAGTGAIYDLLEIDPDTHAPPICELAWGKFTFQGVLDHVNGKFTLFLSDGTPVRATLTVTFKEYIDVDQLVRVQPTHSADHRKVRVVRSGDRIDNIAGEEYGDPDCWREIAEANHLDDPAELVPGQLLVVPALN
ncbi:MAG: LysM peptidoglycan-binding domain-containing protein [Terracidiphilus sp.]